MRPRLRLIALLFALLALSWQTVVAQGHHHFGSIGPGLAAGHSPTAVTRDQPGPDTSDTCPICQQIAYAGTLLLPEAASLHAPSPVVSGMVAAAIAAVAVAGRHSHAWRSRAPPRLRPA